MTLPSRAAVRKEIAAGIETATAGLSPRPTVYSYLKTGFDGQSPIVRVWSESAQRPESALQDVNNRFRVTVQVWVLIDENGTDAEQAESEDIIDAIEVAVAGWVAGNVQTDKWNQLSYERPSAVQTTLVGPHVYIVEQIGLIVLAGGV